MNFLDPTNKTKELTFSDVFLMPGHSDISSRMDVDITPIDGLGMTLPVVIANMTAVAGKRMAQTVTRRGGLVVLPQDYTFEKIQMIVDEVKHAPVNIEVAVELSKKQSVQTALNLINKRSHGAIIVVDDQKRPQGIFTTSDAYLRDRYTTLEEVMTKQVHAIDCTMSTTEAFQFLEEKRLNIAPVVDKNGMLLGVMSKKGILRSTIYKPALNQKSELLTSVAISMSKEMEATVQQYKDIGVDVFVLDTAHGDQKRMIEAITRVRKIIGPDKSLVAGNIVTKEAAERFIKAGANILKVGIGPGAACTTRMMTGVGRPQFSSVHAVSEVARKYGAHVWSDGGCRHPRDVVLALCAGASNVMIGTWFAGTFESPTDVQIDERGRMYKEQFGMASRRAVVNRSRADEILASNRKQFFNEGISHSRMYLKEGQEGAEDILDKISAGLRSACAYVGASNLQELQEKAIIGIQTPAGYAEGAPITTSW